MDVGAHQTRGFGGAEGSRTPDLSSAIAALCQLSYGPVVIGAEERTRTSTGLLPLPPQGSASTNSATSACCLVGLIVSDFSYTNVLLVESIFFNGHNEFFLF